MTVTKTRNHAKHGVKPKTERPADFWNQFVRKPPEEEKKRHFQPSTELGLKVMQKNFERSVLLYCNNTAKTHSLLDSVDCLSQKVPNTGLKILI